MVNHFFLNDSCARKSLRKQRAGAFVAIAAKPKESISFGQQKKRPITLLVSECGPVIFKKSFSSNFGFVFQRLKQFYELYIHKS